MGLARAASAGACRKHAGDGVPAGVGQPELARRGRRRRCSPASSASDTCRWKPDPPSSLNGLAMNVASSPSCRAISCTADFIRNARSAASTSSLWLRLTSNWPAQYSWLAAVTCEAGRAQVAQGPQQQAVGVALAAHHVDVAGAVRRTCVKPRRRRAVGLADEVLELGPTTACSFSCARCSPTRPTTVRGDSGAGVPSARKVSPRQPIAPGSQGSGARVLRSGLTWMSGRPASMPPWIWTTSPIGVV